MANPNPYGPPPWTDAEKNFLLAELIKQAGPQPLHLFNVLESMNANISWSDIPLPTGRTLNEAMNAYAQLRRSAGVPQPLYSTPVGYGGQTPSPMSATGGVKRTFPFESQVGRALRPKPSPTGNIYGPQAPPQIEQPPRKKRGRPTKAEIAARDKAQAATGEASVASLSAQVEVPYTIASVSPATMEPPDTRTAERLPVEPPTAEQARQSLPAPVSRMPISSIITTPAPKSESQSSSSSGKRRRGRSMRAEGEDVPTPSGAGGPVRAPAQEYESPYARITTQAQSSPPATTAAMRYREGVIQASSPQSEQQGQAPQPQPLPNTTLPQPPPPSASPSSPEYTRST